jgi:hypothetical protein
MIYNRATSHACLQYSRFLLVAELGLPARGASVVQAYRSPTGGGGCRVVEGTRGSREGRRAVEGVHGGRGHRVAQDAHSGRGHRAAEGAGEQDHAGWPTRTRGG